MTAKIKSDVLAALADWQAGKPVRSIELGHSHRMKEQVEPTAQPQVDYETFHYRDQERAHDYLFTLLQFWNLHGVPPETHEEFMARCRETETLYRELHEQWEKDLTLEERDGAESLAWKALRVGWQRAIAGHPAEMYIEVTNPAAQVAAT